MALPFLAFLGLGAAGKYGFDRYEQAKDRRLMQTYGQIFSNAIGSPERELQGPQQPGYQGPLMGGGRGLLGGELSIPQFAGEIAQIPGYQGAAQKLITDQLAPKTSRNPMVQELGVGDGKFQHHMLGPNGQWLPIDEPYEKKATTEINMPETNPSSFSDVMNLHKQYANDPATRRFTKLSETFSKIMSAPEFGFGDMNLIFSFMKMLDPDSTILPGEYAEASNTGSVPQVIRGFYNKVRSGNKLTDSQRDQLKYTAAQSFKSQVPLQRDMESRYRKLAKQLEVDPSIVVPDVIGKWRNYEWPEEPVIPDETKFIDEAVDYASEKFGQVRDYFGKEEEPMPNIGDVIDGYEYIGGNPNSEDSWRLSR